MKSFLARQKGVGMMEVLVSIVILSIAVLGFVALQVRATVATEEAIKRSDALIILHGLAEKIRLNPTNAYGAGIPTAEPGACLDSAGASRKCNANDQALIDLYQYSQIAKTKNIVLGVANCPNTSTAQVRLCLIAAWNETQPTINTGTASTGCLNTDGKYPHDADCLVLEAY